MLSTRHVRLAAATGLLAALAACSASPSGPQVASAGGGGPTASSSAAAQDPTHTWARWAACMRQHGVAMTDPVLNAQNEPQIDFSHARGVPESVKRAARQACQSIVANLPGGGTATGPASIQKELAFAKCMRARGVPKFPDPDPATGNLNIAGSGIDPSSPAVRQVEQTCEAQVGGIGG